MSLPSECPLCFSSIENQAVVTSHVFGAKPGESRAFFHCGGCDVRYQYPRLTQQEEAEFYSAEFESFMAKRAGKAGGWQDADLHISANEQTRLRRMSYIAPYLNRNLDVLEVGCSSGFMLFPLVAEGHQCVGVEPSGAFGSFLIQRGIPAYPTIDQLCRSMKGASFDLILHFFVLEHISEPLEFLRSQLNILKPGGRIIFEIPNVSDPLYSIYDIPAFERFYWSVAHPWYFSEASLNFLLRKLGCSYSIIRDQRYDLSNHLVWARDGRPGGMGRFSKVFGSQLDDFYKKTLIQSGLCDTLVGIVSKE